MTVRTMRTIKYKAEPYDIYECHACGRTWSSRAKKIGHGDSACRQYLRKHWGG
jgi:hypothetical protein